MHTVHLPLSRTTGIWTVLLTLLPLAFSPLTVTETLPLSPETSAVPMSQLSSLPPAVAPLTSRDSARARSIVATSFGRRRPRACCRRSARR
jgi:hypothetical protein